VIIPFTTTRGAHFMVTVLGEGSALIWQFPSFTPPDHTSTGSPIFIEVAPPFEQQS
jgi:hypothetical protein